MSVTITRAVRGEWIRIIVVTLLSQAAQCASDVFSMFIPKVQWVLDTSIGEDPFIHLKSTVNSRIIHQRWALAASWETGLGTVYLLLNYFTKLICHLKLVGTSHDKNVQVIVKIKNKENNANSPISTSNNPIEPKQSTTNHRVGFSKHHRGGNNKYYKIKSPGSTEYHNRN